MSEDETKKPENQDNDLNNQNQNVPDQNNQKNIEKDKSDLKRMFRNSSRRTRGVAEHSDRISKTVKQEKFIMDDQLFAFGFSPTSPVTEKIFFCAASLVIDMRRNGIRYPSAPRIIFPEEDFWPKFEEQEFAETSSDIVFIVACKDGIETMSWYYALFPMLWREQFFQYLGGIVLNEATFKIDISINRFSYTRNYCSFNPGLISFKVSIPVQLPKESWLSILEYFDDLVVSTSMEIVERKAFPEMLYQMLQGFVGLDDSVINPKVSDKDSDTKEGK